MNFRRVYAIARLECWRILRDRMSFSLILLVPAMQIALFGAAIDLNPKTSGLAFLAAHLHRLSRFESHS